MKIKYNKLLSNSYLLRFYKGLEYWEIPLDYGLYSQKMMQDQQSLEVYYYLDKNTDAFEFYYYRGKNALGNMGEAVPNIKRKLLIDKTKI